MKIIIEVIAMLNRYLFGDAVVREKILKALHDVKKLFVEADE